MNICFLLPLFEYSLFCSSLVYASHATLKGIFASPNIAMLHFHMNECGLHLEL